ncbi:uncharacterized protein LOC101861590 [Aplysia californica]|uniref:Uncharacterized protein LOC101861590 n=1 Tax=Aplysia californica TaxID=6500 RepID=A0ABM1A1W6_APLCA|nr:uncharacterized protein LOC101861590 [Aplysia californica]
MRAWIVPLLLVALTRGDSTREMCEMVAYPGRIADPSTADYSRNVTDGQDLQACMDMCNANSSCKSTFLTDDQVCHFWPRQQSLSDGSSSGYAIKLCFSPNGGCAQQVLLAVKPQVAGLAVSWTSSDSCVDVCSLVSKCVAVTISGNGQCSFFSALGSTFEELGTTLVVKRPCGGSGAPCCFDNTNSTNSNDAFLLFTPSNIFISCIQLASHLDARAVYVTGDSCQFYDQVAPPLEPGVNADRYVQYYCEEARIGSGYAQITHNCTDASSPENTGAGAVSSLGQVLTLALTSAVFVRLQIQG